MFYQGTVVGCCAIMYEERKGGSREASSKGNKQRQTGLCLPVALLNQAGGLLQENQQTPTQPKQTYPSRTHSHSKWWPGCSAVLLRRQTCTHSHIVLVENKYACLYLYIYVWVFVCVQTWMHQCQGVGHCCFGPEGAPVSSPAQEETGREHCRDVG